MKRGNKMKKMNTVLAMLMAAVFGLTSFSPALTAYAEGTTEAAAVEEPEKEQEDQPYDSSVTVDGLKVTAKADAGVLPSDAKLKVKAITKGDDYKDIEKKLKKDAEDQDKELSAFLAYDISFEVDGQETEPDGNVDVTMEWKDAALPDGADKDADVSVLHLTDNDEVVDLTDSEDEDNTAEVKTKKGENAVEKAEMTVGEFSVFSVVWRKAANSVGANASESEPFDITNTDYIKSTTVSYVQNGRTTTITSGSTIIPDGVRDFEINISYDGINATTLKNQYGGKVSYTIPDFFDSATVTNGTIFDGTNQVGTISIVSEGGANKAVVTFNDTFFGNISEQATITNASIQFRAHANSDKITENPVKVHIGNVDVELNFAEKDVAYTGTLNVEKSNPTYVADSADPANVGYLEYTITVKTGDQAMPQVKVEDTITAGADYVDEFQKQDGTVLKDGDELDNNNGTINISGKKLTWTIGSMEANTTKTFTYRVKLNNNYVGLGDSIGNNKKIITNQAVPYSKTYPHGSDSSTYTPTVTSSAEKSVGDIVDDQKNGTITIPYTITITTDANNPWPVRNVKIADNFGSSYTGSTAAADREAICDAASGSGYGFQNFHLYEIGANNTRTEVSIPARSGSNSNPDVHYESNNTYNPRYDLYLGDVPAGKTYVLEYNLVLKKSFFTSRSGSWSLKNDMTARTDDNKGTNVGGNTTFGSSSVTKTIGQQQWDRKIQSTPTTEAITEHPTGMEEKTVPAGSYKYQVVINEEGKWNASGATLKDVLGIDETHSSTSHMQYSGYLKIDYFKDGIDYGEAGTIPSNESAVSALTSKEPTQTVYVDIDGKQTFSLTPKDHGLPDAAGAYLLTYYATPVGLSNITRMTTGNNFSMGGTVIGPGGGGSFTVGSGTYLKTTVTLEGTSQFTSAKRAWYYDSLNQKLYWVIEAGGSDLEDGLIFRDTTGNNNNRPTLVGAYIGKISDNGGHLDSKYKDLSAFQNDASSFTELVENTDYTRSTVNNTTLDVSIKQTRALEDGEKLYLIVSSSPNISSGTNKRDVYTAENQLRIQEAGTSTFGDEVKRANLVIARGGTDFKEMNRVLQRDTDGNWTSGNSSSIVTSEITEGGVYIDWRIKVNYLSDLSGLVHVTDQLPEGIEPVYVRYFWINSSLVNNRPTMPTINDYENNSEWKEIGLTNTAMDGSMSGYTDTAHAYYNKSTRQIRFDVDKLTSGTGTDTHSLEVQIVTKVTDAEALMNISKTFTNSMTITNEEGVEIARDSANATVKEDSLSKTVANQENGVVPFTITVNPLGEQLADGAASITVIDEMSDPLTFNIDSVKVMDGENDIAHTAQVTIADGGRNSSDNGSILLFTVPNGKKLTITYTATPRVTANGTYSFSNKASWRGYSDGETSLSRSGWRNSLGGTASIADKAQIKVVKSDQTNMFTHLSGAKFSLQEVTWDSSSDAWVNAEGKTATEQTTGNNGEITFTGLEFNAVYKLTETEAPSGYFLNSTPRYIVVAKGTSSGGTTTYPANLDTYRNNGAVIEYNSYLYEADISDTPANLILKKTDMNGGSLTGAEFVLEKQESNGSWSTYTQGNLTNGKITVSSVDGFEITKLSSGTYRLRETKAPDGYDNLNGSIQFKVDGTGISMTANDMASLTSPTAGESEYILSVKNKPGVILPRTGSIGTRIFTVIGLLLIFTAGILLGRRGYLRRHRPQK